MTNFNDYEEVLDKHGAGGSEDGGFMKLKTGDNSVRIVSDFVAHGSHWHNSENRSYACLGAETCPLCLKAAKEEDGVKPPKVRFLGWVIDREDDKIKLLHVGPQIYRQIGALSNDEEYGFEDLPPYDMTIKRDGTGMETEYTVIGSREDTELTEEEEKRMEEVVRDPEEVVQNLKNKTIDQFGRRDPDDDTDIAVEDLPF